MRQTDLNITFVYIIDNSLGMSKGKIAAQVSHVAMSLADMYKCHGRAIVLKTDKKRFNSILDMIGNKCVYVKDAGLTQVAPGTMTCIGFVETEETKKLTKDLKLV